MSEETYEEAKCFIACIKFCSLSQRKRIRIRDKLQNFLLHTESLITHGKIEYQYKPIYTVNLYSKGWNPWIEDQANKDEEDEKDVIIWFEYNTGFRI